MTSLYQDIRGALQVRAATAAGFPAANQIAYEGRVFTSTVGTPWARMTLLPTSGRGYSVSGATKQHVGVMQIDYFAPAGGGTGAAEAVADAVKALFEPGDRLPAGSVTVQIRYAERRPAVITPDWVQIPVDIGWRVFASAN